MAKKKIAAINFKISEELEDLISKTSFEIDKNKSEVIRTCVLLSIDTVKKYPSLVNRIQFEDRGK